MKIFFYTIIVCLQVSISHSEPISDYIRDEYLQMSPEEVARLADAESLDVMEFKPVILPEGVNLWGGNIHFGWPMAAISGDTIIVKFARHLCHAGCDPRNDSWSGTSIIRSTDGGQTWGSMVDIQPLWVTAIANGAAGVGGANIGVNQYGDFIMNGRGILRSTDNGQTWISYPDVYELASQPNAGQGPNMLLHPIFYMLAFNGRVDDSPYPIWIRISRSGYSTWGETAWYSSETNPKEPASVTWGDGHILLLSREYNESFGSDGKTFNMSQHLYKYTPGDSYSDIDFETKRSNIAGNLYYNTGSNDTADLCYNPVTGRIEALHSHRKGGGLGFDGNNQPVVQTTLNLWSIDPNELLAGSNQWRFEGTLLKRQVDGILDNDGLHPGGAVIDTVRGIQHIFVYAGLNSNEKTGIFQITRTLETPKLAKFLKASLPNAQYHKMFVFDCNNFIADMTDVYVMVKLNSDIVDYNQFKNDGSDLFFTDIEQYTLPHKILNWDPMGTSRLIVKIPNLTTGKKNYILMHWGKQDAFFHQYDEGTNPEDKNFTISLWLKNNTASGLYYLINKGNDGSPEEAGWSFSRSSDGQNSLLFRIQDNKFVDFNDFSDTSAWHHVVGIINQTNNNIELYIDGISQGTTDITGINSISSQDSLQIANQTSGSAQVLLDDMFIVNEVLSPTQIQQLHQLGKGNSISISLRDTVPDFEPDGDLDLNDLAAFAMHWLDTNCQNYYNCNGADFDESGSVDFHDFQKISTDWLWSAE